mgnify:CR=1 FL=1
MIVVVIVGSATYINAYGQEHWEEFATQDYFDENGFFVSVVISLPLLLLSVLILVYFPFLVVSDHH